MTMAPFSHMTSAQRLKPTCNMIDLLGPLEPANDLGMGTGDTGKERSLESTAKCCMQSIKAEILRGAGAAP